MKQITIQNSREGGCNAWEQIDLPEIAYITAEELFKRNGSRKGYRYTARLTDGTDVVIRGHSTRLYAFAFMYSSVVATGKIGLASAFTFGQKPATFGSAEVVGQFTITLKE